MGAIPCGRNSTFTTIYILKAILFLLFVDQTRRRKIQSGEENSYIKYVHTTEHYIEYLYRKINR